MRLARTQTPAPGRGAGRGQRGHTLLEVLQALSLLGVVTLTAFSVFNASYRGFLAGHGFVDEHQNARLVLEWMVRRIRLAGVGTAPGTVPWFTGASSSTVAFLTNVDGDENVEEHRFCIDTPQGVVLEEIADPPATTSATCAAGASITSGGSGSIRPLRIVSLTFAYFNGVETQLTSFPAQLSQIRRVRIVLGVDSNRSGAYEQPADLTLTMDAVVRTEVW